MLKYSLSENLLTDRPDDYAAQTHSVDTYDKSKFITRLLGKGTLVTKTDVVAVFDAMESTILEILKEGSTLKLPFFNTSFSISGVFEGPLDSFDSNRHKLNINITKGSLLRQAESAIAFEKTTSVAPAPQIQEVKDTISGTFNEELTPNGVVEIRGNNLKIDGDHADCGLWFVPDTGTPVKADVFVQNKPSLVIAMIPALSTGNYQVKIVSQYASGKNLINPKAFTFGKVLSVQ